MGCVAGITLVSCLFIIILERVKTIGLLKAIGATNRQIRLVFVYMALRLVLRGLLIGNAISLTAVILQDKFRIIPLDPEAYYLSFVPVEINWLHILLLNIGVILVSFLLLLGPSHLVSKISPSQTMRYE
jgi:lipoprotein-releasing system permease protein